MAAAPLPARPGTASLMPSPPSTPAGSRQVCWQFRDLGKCSRGAACRFAHVEKDAAPQGEEPSTDREGNAGQLAICDPVPPGPRHPALPRPQVAGSFHRADSAAGTADALSLQPLPPASAVPSVHRPFTRPGARLVNNASVVHSVPMAPPAAACDLSASWPAAVARVPGAPADPLCSAKVAANGSLTLPQQPGAASVVMAPTVVQPQPPPPRPLVPSTPGNFTRPASPAAMPNSQHGATAVSTPQPSPSPVQLPTGALGKHSPQLSGVGSMLPPGSMPLPPTQGPRPPSAGTAHQRLRSRMDGRAQRSSLSVQWRSPAVSPCEAVQFRPHRAVPKVPRAAPRASSERPRRAVTATEALPAGTPTPDEGTRAHARGRAQSMRLRTSLRELQDELADLHRLMKEDDKQFEQSVEEIRVDMERLKAKRAAASQNQAARAMRMSSMSLSSTAVPGGSTVLPSQGTTAVTTPVPSGPTTPSSSEFGRMDNPAAGGVGAPALREALLKVPN